MISLVSKIWNQLHTTGLLSGLLESLEIGNKRLDNLLRLLRRVLDHARVLLERRCIRLVVRPCRVHERGQVRAGPRDAVQHVLVLELQLRRVRASLGDNGRLARRRVVLAVVLGRAGQRLCEMSAVVSASAGEAAYVSGVGLGAGLGAVGHERLEREPGVGALVGARERHALGSGSSTADDVDVEAVRVELCSSVVR
jgi:hypothetical protein